MIPSLWLLLGLILGAGGVWWLQWAEILWLRREAAEATDRLVHAWRETPSLMVPAREKPAPSVVPEEPLPPDLAKLVDDWESPESRATAEATMRSHLAKGWSIERIQQAYQTLEE